MKRTVLAFLLLTGICMAAFAQKNPAIDTVRAPLGYINDIDRLLISLRQDSTYYRVKLGGKPSDEIPAIGALDLRPGDTLTLCGELIPRKKLRKNGPHMLSARILSVDYACDHDEKPAFLFSLEQKPTFMGHDANFFSNWVNSRLVYPESSRRAGSEGIVRLRFLIDQNGDLTNVEMVESSGDPALNAEAYRVVSSSPRWQPGLLKGQPVRVVYTFPVSFMLKERKTSSQRR